MFEHFFRLREECGGHGPREFSMRGGFGDDFPGGFGRGFGGRGRHGFERFGGRERMFDAGDVRLVILELVGEEPSYGYQLIKRMEERMAGGYTPSAGVIYPTLTMLEEEGLAKATVDNNKKIYSLTDAGREYLRSQEARANELFERLRQAGRGFARGRSPEMMKAFHNLRNALWSRVSRDTITAEQMRKITEIIDSAAKAIDEL